MEDIDNMLTILKLKLKLVALGLSMLEAGNEDMVASIYQVNQEALNIIDNCKLKREIS